MKQNAEKEMPRAPCPLNPDAEIFTLPSPTAVHISMNTTDEPSLSTSLPEHGDIVQCVSTPDTNKGNSDELDASDTETDPGVSVDCEYFNCYNYSAGL